MAGLDDLKIASLSPEDLETIRALEKKLGPTIRLVAVETKDVIYVMEAKMAPCIQLILNVFYQRRFAVSSWRIKQNIFSGGCKVDQIRQLLLSVTKRRARWDFF